MTATPEREALIRNVWRDYRTRHPARWIADYGGAVGSVDGVGVTSEGFE